MTAQSSLKTRIFRFLTISGCLVGAIAISSWVSFLREPAIGGKRISAWRKELATNFRASLQLHEALQQTGTNAIPFLVRAAEANPPLYQRLYARAWAGWLQRAPTPMRRYLQPPASLMFPTVTLRRIALTRLGELGPAAAPIVPALIAILQSRDESVAASVVDVLNSIGTGARPAVPALVKLHAQCGLDVTQSIVAALGNIAPRDSNVVEVLTRSLHDDPRVALVAARILKSNGLETQRVVVALTRLLKVDPSAAWGAASLLEHYGPNAASAVPTLIEMLGTHDNRLRGKAASTLGELGTIAVAAEPALRVALHDAHAHVREAAAVALTKIAVQR